MIIVMKVINKTTNTIIAQDVIIANSFISKNLGLLPYNTPKSLLLKTRFGIHTFGMKYPIDVIILDKNNKVMKLKPALPPNSVFFWNPEYDTVIELPQGTIKQKKVQTADTLTLTPGVRK